MLTKLERAALRQLRSGVGYERPDRPDDFLVRLRKRGFIETTKRISYFGTPLNVVRITPAGRAVLTTIGAEHD